MTTVPSPVGRALADLSLNSSPSAKLTGSLPKQSSWSPGGDTGQLPSWSSEGCQTQVLAFSLRAKAGLDPAMHLYKDPF